MAIYAGETVRIYATTLDWDDTKVTPSTGVAEVTIYDDQARAVVDSELMTWVSERSRWEYDWATGPAGTYTVELTSILNADGDVSKEVRKVRLSDPRPERSRDTTHYVRERDVF